MTLSLTESQHPNQVARDEGRRYSQYLWQKLATSLDKTTMMVPERGYCPVEKAEIDRALNALRPGAEYGSHLASGRSYEDEAGLWYYRMKNVQEQRALIEDASTIIVMCNFDGLGDSIRQIQVALLLARSYPHKKIIACFNHDIFDSNHPDCPRNLSLLSVKKGSFPEEFIHRSDAVFVNPSLENDCTNDFSKLLDRGGSRIARLMNEIFGLAKNKDDKIPGNSALFPSGFAYEGWSMFPEAINYYRFATSNQNKKNLPTAPVSIEEHMLSFFSWVLDIKTPEAPFDYPIYESRHTGSEKNGDSNGSVGIFVDAKELGRAKMLDAIQWTELISQVLKIDRVQRVIIFEGIEHPDEADTIVSQTELQLYNPTSVLLQELQAEERFREAMESPSRLVIARACNQSLRPATKILSQCGVVITVDTVWMHVANALNIPTLCIGGNRGVFDLGYYGPVGNGSMTVFGHKLANSLSISGAYPTVENWVKSHV